MSLNVQPVTFFPVPPVRPVVYDRDRAAEKSVQTQQAPAPARALTGSSTGRLVDIRV
ncbi:hypothetical protein [Phenylobacterium sp. J367]|uniref:hypothetical protein n=1 Tax=Phenylobacterium sp. J367 TaxID=2898435 RepID=UPI0021517B44|nr:hypothetical protein [Phenylobacterium sp. J367]MCR5879416.1 hypothetical protein [Phenylobacterium sp. J367]